jgi:hypothetical protein
VVEGLGAGTTWPFRLARYAIARAFFFYLTVTIRTEPSGNGRCLLLRHNMVGI